MVRLQPDEIVAVVALAKIAAEAGAEPTRERRHLRRRCSMASISPTSRLVSVSEVPAGV